MSNKYQYLTNVVESSLKVLDETETSQPHAIESGLYLNIFYEGKFYPGKVIKCDPKLEPGAKGTVEIWMEDDPDSPSSMREGASFELRGGPLVVIARARAQKVRTRQQ
jgi:hypothetical protein